MPAVRLLRQISLFLLLSLWCSGWAAPPRRLDRCPADKDTLVEPSPASMGVAVLLTAPDVRLETIEALGDTVLRVESDRLLLNGSINWSQGQLNGPHVLLCSDAIETLGTFNLYLRQPEAVDFGGVAKSTTGSWPAETRSTRRPAETTTAPPTGQSTSQPSSYPSIQQPTTQPGAKHGAKPGAKPGTKSGAKSGAKLDAKPVLDRNPPTADPLVISLAIATGLLFALCVALSVALVVLRRSSGRGREDPGPQNCPATTDDAGCRQNLLVAA